MILCIPGRGENADDAPVTALFWTPKLSPYMAMRLGKPPSFGQGILDRLANVLVGMVGHITPRTSLAIMPFPRRPSITSPAITGWIGPLLTPKGGRLGTGLVTEDG